MTNKATLSIIVLGNKVRELTSENTKLTAEVAKLTAEVAMLSMSASQLILTDKQIAERHTFIEWERRRDAWIARRDAGNKRKHINDVQQAAAIKLQAAADFAVLTRERQEQFETDMIPIWKASYDAIMLKRPLTPFINHYGGGSGTQSEEGS